MECGYGPGGEERGEGVQGGREISGAEKVRNRVEHRRGTSLLVHEQVRAVGGMASIRGSRSTLKCRAGVGRCSWMDGPGLRCCVRLQCKARGTEEIVKKWMAAAGALDGEEQANGWMDGWRVLSGVSFLLVVQVRSCRSLSKSKVTCHPQSPARATFWRSPKPDRATKQGPNLSHPASH
jgi:hypothetical protein